MPAFVLLLLKLSILLTAGWFAVSLAKSRSADFRHRLWALTLASTLLLPILTAITPHWRPVLISRAIGQAARPVARPATSSAITSTVVNAIPARLSPATLIGFVWLAGGAVMLLRLARGLIVLLCIGAQNCTILHNAWMFGTIDAAKRFGISKPVRLLESRKPRSMPLTWGFFRPAILLPPEAQDWDADRRNLVLLHELAHIARADWPVQILAELARAIYWFHPLIWIAAGRLRQESEQAADDAVLNAGVSPTDYAAQLLDLARNLRTADPAWSTALAVARTTNLERRFTAMLNPSLNRRRASRPAALFTTVAALALLLPIAALQSPAQDRAGRFAGSVLDPRAALVPNATVILANTKSGAKNMTTSDIAGHYEFNGLPAGDYQMTVLQPGFASWSGHVVLAPTQNAAQDVSLSMGQVKETVNVHDGAVSAAQPVAASDPRRIRIGGNVQATKLITKINPVYPAAAKQARSQGAVQLQGLIGENGRVSALTVLNSEIDPDLARAAVEAVQQWVYQPTLLNGEPIDVITNITVNFTLMP